MLSQYDLALLLKPSMTCNWRKRSPENRFLNIFPAADPQWKRSVACYLERQIHETCIALFCCAETHRCPFSVFDLWVKDAEIHSVGGRNSETQCSVQKSTSDARHIFTYKSKQH